MAQIEPISLAQNEPKRIGTLAKSGTDQTEMPGTITPKWVAQNEPKYPESFRKTVIESIAKNDVKLISGFLVLFSKSIDETWVRAEPRGAFWAYNENLQILLDVIENIELSKIPPALLESIAYNLDHVSCYIGTSLGESRAAYRTWESRKDKIPKGTYWELFNIGRVRRYYNLNKLLKPEKGV